MTLRWALPIALALAAWPLAPAMAQFGGMPGPPGSGGGVPGSPFGAQPQVPPPLCQQLLSYRDDTQKHGQALRAAGQKRAPPEEVCKLFKAFLAAETKLADGLEENAATCGVPPEVIKQVKASHAKATQTGRQVCDVAQRGRPRFDPVVDPFADPPGSFFDAPAPRCSEKTLQSGIPCVN
jgi:hypothetical protein